VEQWVRELKGDPPERRLKRRGRGTWRVCDGVLAGRVDTVIYDLDGWRSNSIRCRRVFRCRTFRSRIRAGSCICRWR